MNNPELKPVFKVFCNDPKINPNRIWETILMPITATPAEIEKKVLFYTYLKMEVNRIK